MKLRSCAYGLALFACVALLPIPPTLAQVAGSQSGPGCADQPLQWSQDRLAKFNAAITGWEQDFAKRQSPAAEARQWAQDQLSEFDTAIASVAQDAASRPAAVRAKAEALLNELRDERDAYRLKVREASATMTMSNADQVTDARESLNEAANAFWAKVNAYLDAVNADIDSRQAIMQAQPWQFD